MAETCQQFLILAQNCFARSFSKKTFEITDPLPTGAEYINDEVIRINNYKLSALRILQNFGHLIQKLVVRDSSKDVIQSISFYCAETLIEFDIDNEDNLNFFDELTKPFKKVRNLSLKGSFKSLQSSTRTCDELFPSLRNLSLGYVYLADSNSVVCEFQNLEQLYVHTFQFHLPHHIGLQDFRDLLKKNPQIRKLKLDHNSREILTDVNAILPDLEILELQTYNPLLSADDDGTIVFENLKSFTIIDSVDSAPRNTDFPNLTEFRAVDSLISCDRWLSLIEKQSSHLEKLVVDKDTIHNEELGKLATMNSNFSEIILKIVTDVTDETIIKFIRNAHNLQKLDLFAYNRHSFEAVADAIKKEFGDIFAVVGSSHGLLIKRVN